MTASQVFEERWQTRALSVLYMTLERLQIQTAKLDVALRDSNGTMHT